MDCGHACSKKLMVGAVGIEISSLLSKSIKENGVAPPPHSKWCQLAPSAAQFLGIDLIICSFFVCDVAELNFGGVNLPQTSLE